MVLGSRNLLDLYEILERTELPTYIRHGYAWQGALKIEATKDEVREFLAEHQNDTLELCQESWKGDYFLVFNVYDEKERN